MPELTCKSMTASLCPLIYLIISCVWRKEVRVHCLYANVTPTQKCCFICGECWNSLPLCKYDKSWTFLWNKSSADLEESSLLLPLTCKLNNKRTEGACKVEAVALVIADRRAIGTRSVRRQDRLHLCQQEPTVLLPQRHGRQLAKKTCSLKALRHFLSVSWTTVNAAVIGRCVTSILKSSRHTVLNV